MSKRGKIRKRSFKAKNRLFQNGSHSARSSIASNGTQQLSSDIRRVHPPSEDSYPLYKLCRLCLLSNMNMEPIFAFEGDQRLSDKIFECTGLKIEERRAEGIPCSICSECKKALDQCHEFRLLCWKNNEILFNLHAILSPKKAQISLTPTQAPVSTPSSPYPMVQLQRVDLGRSPLRRGSVVDVSISGKKPAKPERVSSNTPAKRNLSSQMDETVTKELVIPLSPLSPSAINKLKKATANQMKSNTVTKAAVKSFPQNATENEEDVTSSPPSKEIMAKISTPKLVSAIKKAKAVPKKSLEKKIKKLKVIPDEIAVPPKKRKEHFKLAAFTPEPPLACTLCTQTISNEKGMRRHMEMHEKYREEKRVFKCDVCKREYLKFNQLTDHLRSLEHVKNAGSDAPNDGDISILPDAEAEALTEETQEQQQQEPEQPEPSQPEPTQPQPEQEQEEENDVSATREIDTTDDSVQVVAESDETAVAVTIGYGPATAATMNGDGGDEGGGNNVAEVQNPPPVVNDTELQPTMTYHIEDDDDDEDEDENDDIDRYGTLNECILGLSTTRAASPMLEESIFSPGLIRDNDGTQYGDACTTNSTEKSSQRRPDSVHSQRRVTFSDVTEIVE